MKPIEWKPRAERNLAAIVAYIFERNPVAALELQELAFKSAENLSFLPFMGRIGRVAGIRELVIHPNYIIVYRLQAQKIEIVAVLHSRQAYP